MHQMGIIGYGGMASWHHENIRRIEGLQVAAAYDVDPQRVRAAREKGLAGYDSLEAFWKHPGMEFVLVATPNNFHMELAIAAMEHGKHVICEKPVAMSGEELAEMTAAAKRYGVVFTVHQNRRWDRDFRIVKRALAQGLLGKPYTIESRVHGQNGVVEGWRAHKVAGGGMLLDWGVHLIDQLLYLIPEPVVEVCAHLHSLKTPEVDDYCKVLMRFASGLSAQIEVGTYCLQPLPRWYVNGDAGSLVIDDFACTGRIVRANQYALDWEPEIVQTAAGPTRTMAPRPKETLATLPLPDAEDEADWTAFYPNVLAAAEGREALLVTPAEAARVFAVMEAAFASHEEGMSFKVHI